MFNRYPVIIAEAGVNHDGDLDTAIRLVHAAKAAGADVVKFQHFAADKLASPSAPAAKYQTKNTGKRHQVDMLGELELGLDAFQSVADVCRQQGIEFLCTAFDPDVIDDLVNLGMKRIKVPSGELTNVRLLKRYGALGLPVLLSTGMGAMEEVGAAVAILEAAGATDITLLQCTSLYPAPAETLNLRAMISMAEEFRRQVGLSDHSLGDYAAVAAVALGASVIEKHLTLDRQRIGPDHRASLEPGEFKTMVERLRATALALGDGKKAPVPAEVEMAKLVRRSWHAAKDIPVGRVLESSDLVLRRPAAGLPPVRDPTGHRARLAIAADSPITVDMIEP